ncbi:MAG: hypothetical protein J6U58_05510 [Bacteroidaceae bacterium]|nr:hypothetical protein [Bacteroidaceae bacterium]
MKKTIFLLLVSVMLFSGCSDIFERQLDIYNDAIEELDDVKSLSDLLDKAINTECDIASVMALATEEEWNELREDYEAAEYDVMLDSVDAVRDIYFRNVEHLYNGYVMHFVEKRIALYGKVATAYSSAIYIEQVAALNDFLKSYSAKAYIDGQRVCDPPEEIKKEYNSIKALAKQNYEEALVRLGGE